MFYWTDAIAGVSGGTKIYQKDFGAWSDITSYNGRIVGHYVNKNPDQDSSYSVIWNVPQGNGTSKLMISLIFASNNVSIWEYTSRYVIRLLYI